MAPLWRAARSREQRAATRRRGPRGVPRRRRPRRRAASSTRATRASPGRDALSLSRPSSSACSRRRLGARARAAAPRVAAPSGSGVLARRGRATSSRAGALRQRRSSGARAAAPRRCGAARAAARPAAAARGAGPPHPPRPRRRGSGCRVLQPIADVGATSRRRRTRRQRHRRTALATAAGARFAPDAPPKARRPPRARALSSTPHAAWRRSQLTAAGGALARGVHRARRDLRRQVDRTLGSAARARRAQARPSLRARRQGGTATASAPPADAPPRAHGVFALRSRREASTSGGAARARAR